MFLRLYSKYLAGEKRKETGGERGMERLGGRESFLFLFKNTHFESRTIYLSKLVQKISPDIKTISIDKFSDLSLNGIKVYN